MLNGWVFFKIWSNTFEWVRFFLALILISEMRRVCSDLDYFLFAVCCVYFYSSCRIPRGGKKSSSSLLIGQAFFVGGNPKKGLTPKLGVTPTSVATTQKREVGFYSCLQYHSSDRMQIYLLRKCIDQKKSHQLHKVSDKMCKNSSETQCTYNLSIHDGNLEDRFAKRKKKYLQL